jgi:hypothetical protein
MADSVPQKASSRKQERSHHLLKTFAVYNSTFHRYEIASLSILSRRLLIEPARAIAHARRGGRVYQPALLVLVARLNPI